MTHEELDAMWSIATRKSIEENQPYTRYEFAKMVAAKEHEAFIALCKTYLEASEKANNGVSPVVTMVIEDCIKRIELRGME
jgi:hypothetical protein